ncbi:hypothetical protein BH23CHL10_BH23CHL10_01020 [soil metagenome]
MWLAFPTSDYYGPSVPPRHQQPTAGLPVAALAERRGGRRRDGSHVQRVPVDGGGAQLFPYSLATGTPQAFSVALVLPIQQGSEVAVLISEDGVHCRPARIYQV